MDGADDDQYRFKLLLYSTTKEMFLLCSKRERLWGALNPITYGIAFDAILDPLGVKIERRYYLTIPIYTYRSV